MPSSSASSSIRSAPPPSAADGGMSSPPASRLPSSPSPSPLAASPISTSASISTAGANSASSSIAGASPASAASGASADLSVPMPSTAAATASSPPLLNLSSSARSVLCISRSVFHTYGFSLASLYMSSIPSAGSACCATGRRYDSSEGTVGSSVIFSSCSSVSPPWFHSAFSSFDPSCTRRRFSPTLAPSSSIGKKTVRLRTGGASVAPLKEAVGAARGARSNTGQPSRFQLSQSSSDCSTSHTLRLNSAAFGPVAQRSSLTVPPRRAASSCCAADARGAPFALETVTVWQKMAICVRMCLRK
mmetsp:Transcript_14606/g.36931  ORF Transcript_14606/g.36931 Transcript_14606/m.36931 type:complete len:304 (-) Transcript_14606:872-1783(-)